MRRTWHATTDPSNPESRNCARGLSGYRQIPLPQQFSQSKNSSLRRACAFREVSRDYCILLPFPFPAPPPRDIVAISATYGPFLVHDHRDIWGRCSSEQRSTRLARSRSKLCRYPRQRNKPRDAPTREYICRQRRVTPSSGSCTRHYLDKPRILSLKVVLKTQSYLG